MIQTKPFFLLARGIFKAHQVWDGLWNWICLVFWEKREKAVEIERGSGVVVAVVARISLFFFFIFYRRKGEIAKEKSLTLSLMRSVVLAWEEVSFDQIFYLTSNSQLYESSIVSLIYAFMSKSMNFYFIGCNIHLVTPHTLT